MTPRHDGWSGGDWTWRWIPDPAAQFGDNPIADWLRLAVFLAVIVIGFLCLRVIREQRRRAASLQDGQGARFVALALAAVYIAITELAVFGTPATPRLFLAIGFVIVSGWGLAKMRRQQLRQPVTGR